PGTVQDRVVADAAGIEAGAAGGDIRTVPHQSLQHGLDVVVALRDLLSRSGAGGGVADEKQAYRSAVLRALEQLTRVTDAVVAALGSVGRIVQNEEIVHDDTSLRAALERQHRIALLDPGRQRLHGAA